MNLMKVIEERLAQMGITAASASRSAVGNASFVKNIRAGSSPSIDKLEKLANVLDLELYFGPPRSNEQLRRAAESEALDRVRNALGLGADATVDQVVEAAQREDADVDPAILAAVERGVQRALEHRPPRAEYVARLEQDVAMLFELKSLAQAIREDAERSGKPLSFEQIKAKMRAILDDDGAGPNLADQTEQ